MAETFVQVNAPSNPDKKLKAWDSLDGNGDLVLSEAVVIADSDGNEISPATEGTLAAVLAELAGKTEPADPQHVVVDSMPAISFSGTIGTVDQGAPGATAWPVDGSGVTQPVSAAALPLPTGASTEATLAAIKAKTDNLDVALSTRAVTGLTDAQLRAAPVPVSGTVTATGPLTDTQLRASAVPVSAASLPLPTGAATDAGLAAIFARQADGSQHAVVDASALPTGASTEATLAAIKAKTDNLDVALSTRTKPADQQHVVLDTGANTVGKVDQGAGGASAWKVDGSAVTQPVSAASLPLPTGAATAALQTQPGVDIGDVTVNNGAGAAAVNVQDGGNSLTVDGSVSITGSVAVTGPLTDTQLRASAVPVSDGAGSLTVDSTQLPAALGQTTMAASLPVALASNQSALPVTDNAGSLTVDSPGVPTALGQSTMANSMRVVVASDQTNVAVNAAAWLGSTSPTVGQKVSAQSIPVVLSSDGNPKVFQVGASKEFGPSSLGALNAAKAITGITGYNAVAIYLNPTSLVGTVIFECRGLDGTEPTSPIALFSFDPTTGAYGPPVTSVTNPGSTKYYVGLVPPHVDLFQARLSAWTSGSVACSVWGVNGNSVMDAVVGQMTMASSRPVAIASDQTAVPTSSTQLPSALVGGRLDENVGAWLGSTAPTVGQKASASSVPVTLASDQVYAEDTPHVTGDAVHMAGVVQQAADAALSSDGDRTIPQVDATGFLKVNVKTQTIERASAGAPVGVTVSTAAVLVLAANASAKSRIIVNCGSSNVFLGRSGAVTASGAAMGIKLAPGGTYADSGLDLDTGDIYAIGDATSASQNVSAWERT